MDTPVADQPTPNPPKNNSNIFIGILVFIFGIAVGLMVDKMTLLSNLRIPYFGATPTPTPFATPTPTQDPTADWKIYTNTTHNFSFKYPSDWVLNSKGDSDQYNAHLSLKKDKNVVGIMANLDGIGGGPRNVPYEEISLWGKTYYKQYGDINFSTNTKTVDICDSPHGLGVFKINDKTFMISLTYPATTEGEKPTAAIAQEFDQILSMFKFLDQTTVTPTTTYTCPPGGWVDCMPIMTPEKQAACSPEAMAWYEANCPDFKGGAL